MKGIRNFNCMEAQQIRAILKENPRTTATRNKLRHMGFYISDFVRKTALFSIDNFEVLVSSGEVKIASEGTGNILKPRSDKRQNSENSSIVNLSDVELIRRQYRPERVKFLLLGESVPEGGDFFYYATSNLFRQTLQAFREVFADECGDGAQFLRFFRDRHFFLDDLCSVPVNGMDDADRVRERTAGVRPFVERLKATNPEYLIVVMKKILPEAHQACELADMFPPLLGLPFPSWPKHQELFVRGLADFLRTSGLSS